MVSNEIVKQQLAFLGKELTSKILEVSSVVEFEKEIQKSMDLKC